MDGEMNAFIIGKISALHFLMVSMMSATIDAKMSNDDAIESVRSWRSDTLETISLEEFEKAGPHGAMVYNECVKELNQIFKNLEIRVSSRG